ncbi:MAG TPA: VOC family protein [Stenotrophobium sp.]|nr:VOC family protein [Stenotrophobium sp.]
MSPAVKPIPDGHAGATPYLTIRDAAHAIELYKQAFGAVETLRLDMPDGRVGHAEMMIGGALLMIGDEFPEMEIWDPQTLGGSPVAIHIYVEDVDALAARAVAAGIKLLRPVADQFYGDRGGKFEDPYGHVWWFATHKEDVSVEEMQKRATALFGGG